MLAATPDAIRKLAAFHPVSEARAGYLGAGELPISGDMLFAVIPTIAGAALAGPGHRVRGALTGLGVGVGAAFLFVLAATRGQI